MPTSQQQQQQQQQREREREQVNNDRLTMRVAQAELASGGGKVYVRLSKGSVPFLTDRSKAKAQVSTRLRQEILQEEGDYDYDANDNNNANVDDGNIDVKQAGETKTGEER